METAVCKNCAIDVHLKKIIEDEGPYFKELFEKEGEDLVCTQCGSRENAAIPVSRLGAILEPIMREHFRPGPMVRRFSEDDREWDEQEGEDLNWVLYEVLGQNFDFDDEIIGAVIEAEDARPQDGDDPYWDDTSLYVESKVQLAHLYETWNYTLEELKHGRRFFSPAANTLFSELFTGVDSLRVWANGAMQPVLHSLPSGTKVYRARVCTSKAIINEIFASPFERVGPPPKELASAGRMNAEGVVVFYGALDVKTCLAEMRPAIGNETAVITVKTTKELRVLDFTSLSKAYVGQALSYLQPDFTSSVERAHFLRKLHRLISQPIAPGHESDYLITQTMAEYLAHVHEPSFRGVMFESAQHAGGMNVVLFADPELLSASISDSFSVEYELDSVSLHATRTVEYSHEQLTIFIGQDGSVSAYASADDLDEEDFD